MAFNPRSPEESASRVDHKEAENRGAHGSAVDMNAADSGQPLVSVVILNWNTKDMTARCIASVQQQSYGNVEILVVDNGSRDGSAEYLSRVPGIRLIPNRRNLGFTGGNIVARRYAHGKYLLLVNSDAYLPTTYIEAAIETAESDPMIAAVGGRSYPKEPLDDVSFYYTYQNIDPFSFQGVFSGEDIGIAHEVNWVSGSCLLLRTAALEQTGYFYNRFFAYYEEADLFARMKYFGYKIVYNPSLRIVHEDASSSSEYFQTKQLLRNRFIFGLRHVCGPSNTLKFISEYYLQCLKGAARWILRGRRDGATRALLAMAFVMVPNTIASLISRLTIGKPAKSISYSKMLLAEQTSISFLSCYSPEVDLDRFSNFVKAAMFPHHNSEFLIAVDQCSDAVGHVTEYLAERNLNAIVRVLPVIDSGEKQIEEQLALNAKNDYIWYLADSDYPSGVSIEEEIMSLFSDAPSSKLIPNSTSVKHAH